VETDLIGIGYDHALIPKRCDRPVYDVVEASRRSPMIGPSAAAVVNKAPKVIGAEVASAENQRIQRCQGIAVNY